MNLTDISENLRGKEWRCETIFWNEQAGEFEGSGERVGTAADDFAVIEQYTV